MLQRENALHCNVRFGRPKKVLHVCDLMKMDSGQGNRSATCLILIFLIDVIWSLRSLFQLYMCHIQDIYIYKHYSNVSYSPINIKITLY